MKAKPEGRVISVRRCGECDRDLGVDSERTPAHVVCQGCAAISVYDPGNDAYRRLLTQEWIDVVLLPGFYDLIEERQAALERITSPANSGHARRA